MRFAQQLRKRCTANHFKPFNALLTILPSHALSYCSRVARRRGHGEA